MHRDPRVCISVDDERPPFTFAMLEGTAEFIDDANASLYWATRSGGRYMGSEQAEAYGKRNSVEGELLVRVTFTNVLRTSKYFIRSRLPTVPEVAHP